MIDKAPQHLKAFIIVAFNTGMRLGEIRLLKRKYIDTINHIRSPADITKEKKTKDIPINHHVKEVLDSLPRAIMHDFVLTYKGRAIKSAGGLKRSFRTAWKSDNIPFGRDAKNGLIFHDIRRTVKTYMTNSGVDKVFRDLILGHRLKGMDVHYMLPDYDPLRNAMEKYSEYIDGQIQNLDHAVQHGL